MTKANRNSKIASLLMSSSFFLSLWLVSSWTIYWCILTSNIIRTILAIKAKHQMKNVIPICLYFLYSNWLLHGLPEYLQWMYINTEKKTTKRNPRRPTMTISNQETSPMAMAMTWEMINSPIMTTLNPKTIFCTLFLSK